MRFRDTKERGGKGKEVVLSVGDNEDGRSWSGSCSVSCHDDFSS